MVAGGRRKKNDNNDSFDEESAKEIYGKQHFEAPVNKGLETVLESEAGVDKAERSSRATKGKLQPKLRLLTSQPYFLEDKEKSALRRKQTTKLFKGRKKIKWKGLTSKQEEKLLNVITEKSDTEEDDSDVENAMPPPPLPAVADDEKLGETLNEIESTASCNSSIAEEIDQKIKDADDFFGPLGFSDDDMEEDISQTRKNNQENSTIAVDNRRKSVLTKVRRSSRFFRGAGAGPLKNLTNNLGSVYQDVEIEERSSHRRSKLFSMTPELHVN